MNSTLVFSRAMISQHVFAAAAAVVLAIAGISAWSFDRRAPLTFEGGHILPVKVTPGTPVNVRWHTVWHRQCEGVVSREVTGSDGVIRPYAKVTLRIPINVGDQTSDTSFWIPHTMPTGRARYAATVRFERCGYTSGWWPIEVRTPPVWFDVVAPP